MNASSILYYDPVDSFSTVQIHFVMIFHFPFICRFEIPDPMHQVVACSLWEHTGIGRMSKVVSSRLLSLRKIHSVLLLPMDGCAAFLWQKGLNTLTVSQLIIYIVVRYCMCSTKIRLTAAKWNFVCQRKLFGISKDIHFVLLSHSLVNTHSH